VINDWRGAGVSLNEELKQRTVGRIEQELYRSVEEDDAEKNRRTAVEVANMVDTLLLQGTEIQCSAMQ
jgi:hypothetical protein